MEKVTCDAIEDFQSRYDEELVKKLQQKKRRNRIVKILLAALAVFVVWWLVNFGFLGMFFHYSLPPTLVYQGERNENFEWVYQGTGGSIGVNGQEIELEFCDTAELEQIGVVSDYAENGLPEKEFSTNCGSEAIVGAPIYRVEIAGEEWLMIEVEEVQKINGEDWPYLVQTYFGDYPE